MSGFSFFLLVSVNDVNEEDIDIGGNDMPSTNFPPVEIEKDTAVRNSKSSSSSSSSSDSGSSSSGLCYFEPFIVFYLNLYDTIKYFFDFHVNVFSSMPWLSFIFYFMVTVTFGTLTCI